VIREGSLPVIPDFLKSDTWYLHNIETDPGELKDLKEQLPQRFAQMREALLAVPRSKSVQFATDQPWDTFGGEETRAPWAEAASRRNEGSTTQSQFEQTIATIRYKQSDRLRLTEEYPKAIAAVF
tara:strand:- start:1897 stop:2271 length:375 start_codon:yes stop_codon:yes gene_type:complete